MCVDPSCVRNDQYSGYIASTSPRACGTKLASCANCLAFMALRAAATARAAGVESESAIEAPAGTLVLGAVEAALLGLAGAAAAASLRCVAPGVGTAP